MRLEARKLLYDIQQAATLLAQFTAGKEFADYAGDAMLRAAVERKFEIIGEAIAQLAKLDQELATRISQHRSVIDFRNALIHGYADVDDRLVWDVVETRLPVLTREIDALLGAN
jgi:uncharacterized protein with HEPN domain